jgi:hypothetical protein
MDFSQLVPRKGLAQTYTPEELLDMFSKYVAHNSTDGLIWVYERVKYKNSSQLEPTPKRPPLTTKGFCLFARMSHVTFTNYLNAQSNTYTAFNEVAQYIQDYCAVDVFNGAAVGTFNGNLAAAIIKKNFGLTDEDDSKGGRNVDTIRHEIVFSDYTDVTNVGALPPAADEIAELSEGTEKVKQALEATMNSERLATLNAQTKQEQPSQWEYDNLPNTSSRQDNTSEYRERNGIVDE